jgi:hypothetical protein
MSLSPDARPLSLQRPQRAVEGFAEFSAGERERRQNAGGDFDAARFDAAVALVLRKLERLEQEGLA